MKINYFFGKEKAQINAILSAAAWNLRKLMEWLKKNLSLFASFFHKIIRVFLKKCPEIFAL
jgi:hypothetical protein